MGVQGLNSFMENCCPQSCISVCLRKMANEHTNLHPDNPPSLVVDAMACVRQWYSCKAWVHGGQWKEYMHILEEFISAFTAVGIRLVFYFDGVVEERKRTEWVRRRLRSNKDIAKIFRYIKSHRQQPAMDLFSLPSGLATFSRFALKALGQETKCSTREGDYEIAHYANSHKCMGILGQDSDFVIYNTVPYLSASKLCLQTMTTVMFSRDKLCQALALKATDLPLLACLLGNDYVPETCMRHIRDQAVKKYRCKGGGHQGEKVFAISDYINTISHLFKDGITGIASTSLSAADKQLLESGMHSYVLPGQKLPWSKQDQSDADTDAVCVMEEFVDSRVLQVAKEKHERAECFMLYNILFDGVVECSNTLEDEDNTELSPQAAVFQPIRERLYGLLLSRRPEDHAVPAVKEWYVFPGNTLQEPKMVSPKPLNKSGTHPDIRELWIRQDSEIRPLQLATFLDLLDLRDYTEYMDRFEPPVVVVLCLVSYIALQVTPLSLEDVEAYLSQAVCLRSKTHTDLCHTQVPQVDPRAVQLGSLFVRGLTHLAAANSACGCPISMDDLMPWKTFDGLLFHQKYLLAHSSQPHDVLLEGNASWMSLFTSLRDLVIQTCGKRERTILGVPQRHPQTPGSSGDREAHFSGDDTSLHGGPSMAHNRGDHRGAGAFMRGHGFRPRGRRPERRRYNLAPRWPQQQHPPGPYWP